MEKKKDEYASLIERRTSERYFVISEDQLNELAAKSGKAGGVAAVNDFISLLGRKTLRNVGISIAAAVAVASAWLSDMVHFGARH